MIKSMLVVIFIALFCIVEVTAMKPIIKVLNMSEAYTENLLQNGDLERIDKDLIYGWSPYRNGYKNTPQTGRNNSVAVLCKNEKASEGSGISQTVELNRKTAIPVIVRGWSKAENVSGSKDSGYSIYVDITYQDGTPLWGQTGAFSTGTHDWEMQEFLIMPEKPVKSLTIYGLFRGHTGSALFDDFQLYELNTGGISMLDSVPVEIPEFSSDETGEIYKTSTRDGLSIAYNWSKGSISSLKLNDREISQQSVPSGFLVRDVSANSGFYAFKDGICNELGLSLNVNPVQEDNCLHVEGYIDDMTGNDRAITLIFALPVDAKGWKWHDDVRNFRIIEKGKEYINCVNIHTGLNGMMSLYPFGNISNERDGLALAMDMDVPEQYRIAYNSYTNQFFISYDFGISKDTDKFPSSAPFKFVIYRTDPQWGFRSASKKLYEIFPDYFACRSKDQGIWMPFTDVSTVQGWEDFGFKYHEGNNNVPFDDTANILSFRYTEPSTWWMRMDQSVDRTDENILKQLNEYAKSDKPNIQRPAEATVVSGSFDENGKYQYQVLDTPWSNGAVFSSNPNPYIPGNSEATMKWNEETKEHLYGSNAKGILDGEYLDSLEGYVTANENFRKEHFHYVTVPLMFSTTLKKPLIHKMSSAYEFSKWLAEDVHKMGKLMFANSVPHSFAFLCPFFDVMGTEMDWIGSDGKWDPASDNWMNFKRIMCYQKPYLFLMNTNYDRFTPDLVKKYFQRSLFYGMYPSMFSHNASDDPYWRAPNLYNRDRNLFKKYIPIIKKIAEAGWEPISYAVTDKGDVYIERFGPDADGNVYFTLLNNSNETLETNVTILINELKLGNIKIIEDIISGEKISALVTRDNIKLTVKMSPEQVRLFNFRRD